MSKTLEEFYTTKADQTRAQWISQNLKRRTTSQGGQTRKRGIWNAVSRKRRATSPQGLEWESLDGKRSKINDVNDRSHPTDVTDPFQNLGMRDQ